MAIQTGIILFLCFIFALPAQASGWVERPDWARHFRALGTQGTFVMYEADKDRLQVLDRKRAEKRYLPASTFNIANALLALDLQVVQDENELFSWNGQRYNNKAWEKDLTFQQAMQVSAVPVFQEIARRIGTIRMQKGLERLDYGNRNSVEGGIDQFWLSGGLRISAMEQIAFLRRLDQGLLGVSATAQETVKKMIVVESASNYTLRAKTGTNNNPPYSIVWWVGWVERKTPTGIRRIYFALNMDTTPKTRSDDRITVARKILREEGALPEK